MAILWASTKIRARAVACSLEAPPNTVPAGNSTVFGPFSDSTAPTVESDIWTCLDSPAHPMTNNKSMTPQIIFLFICLPLPEFIPIRQIKQFVFLRNRHSIVVLLYHIYKWIQTIIFQFQGRLSKGLPASFQRCMENRVDIIRHGHGTPDEPCHCADFRLSCKCSLSFLKYWEVLWVNTRREKG